MNPKLSNSFFAFKNLSISIPNSLIKVWFPHIAPSGGKASNTAFASSDISAILSPQP